MTRLADAQHNNFSATLHSLVKEGYRLHERIIQLGRKAFDLAALDGEHKPCAFEDVPLGVHQMILGGLGFVINAEAPSGNARTGLPMVGKQGYGRHR